MIRYKLREKGEETHHRVFDIEVDAGLLGVNPDLDRKVDCPMI